MVADGGTEVTLDLADIIRLTPIGSTFWNRIDGSVDAGFSFAQANIETHLTTNASANYRGRRYAHGDLRVQRHDARGCRPDVPQQLQRRRAAGCCAIGGSRSRGASSSRTTSCHWIFDCWERGGFGRDVVHTNHRLWSVFSGLAYTHEQFSGEPSDESCRGGARR